jgi:transposase
MARRRFLTDKMWAKIGPLLPEVTTGPKGGRPWRSNREVLEGILWILRTGAPWADLPQEYPSPTTCWRRLRRWEEQGVWLKVWRAFLAQLDEKGTLAWQEAFLDASFAPAKGGAKLWEPPSGARGRSGWWWSTARVFLWEANLPRHRRRKSSSQKRLSTRSRQRRSPSG